MLAATVPVTPAAPTTYIDSNNVVVQWAAPYNGGSRIIGYSITILSSDGINYYQDLVNCDGS